MLQGVFFKFIYKGEWTRHDTDKDIVPNNIIFYQW